MKEVFLQVAVYAGVPSANAAFALAKRVLAGAAGRAVPDGGAGTNDRDRQRVEARLANPPSVSVRAVCVDVPPFAAQALVPLEPSLSELTGPAFGADTVRPEDADLTRVPGAAGEALGQRIYVTGRVLRGKRPARSPTRWSRSGRRTPPADTFTTSIATMRRSIRISPAADAA